MSTPNAPPFAAPQRILTGHDSAGKSIFISDVHSEVDIKRPDHRAHLGLIYMTTSVPAKLNDKKDIDGFRFAEASPIQLVEPNGTRVFICDMHPGSQGAMHRTESIDFITILEGEVELCLDSGETKRVRRGDTVVQRGTMHAWRNVTGPNDCGGWSRMLCVLVSAEKVKLDNGQVLNEDVSQLEKKPAGKEQE